MPRALLCLSLVLWISTSLLAQDVSPDWVRVKEDAGWTARDSQGEVAYKDRLWIFGGWFNSYEAPPRDVWSSADGKSWELIEKQAPWKHSDLSMSVVFKDRMWFMGGWYNGRLKGHSARNQGWSSTDGVKWEQATDNAGWTPRVASALVTFKGKMWLLGGTENYYFGDQSSLKNDVWSSEDGRSWTRATENAGWSPRAYHQAAVLNDRIYVFGGGNYVPEYQATNDDWSSADGVTWRRKPKRLRGMPGCGFRHWCTAITCGCSAAGQIIRQQTGVTSGTRRTVETGNSCSQRRSGRNATALGTGPEGSHLGTRRPRPPAKQRGSLVAAASRELGQVTSVGISPQRHRERRVFN